MLAIIDERTPAKISDALIARGHSLLQLKPHPALPAPVASHPDMLLFFARNFILCTKDYARIANAELMQISAACAKPIVTVDERVSDRYPNDILFNCATIGKHVFCHPSHTAKAIVNDSDYTIHPVRQGYAKCSVVPVGDHALITADPAIASVAKRDGFDVLQITSSKIDLPAYDTGFLGGATSFAPYCGIKEIYFCGDLQTHPDAKEITAFCHRHGRIPVSLTKDPLTDLGTVFLI